MGSEAALSEIKLKARGDIWLRRCAANAGKFAHREAILATQLKRSRDLLASISECYDQPPILLKWSSNGS
jgi:hypothetical protein